MRGTEHAVVYSEYGEDFELNEMDRCLIDKVHKEGLKELDMNGVDIFWERLKKKNEEDIERISAFYPSLISKEIYKKYKNKGEEKLLKIIIRNKETGKQSCIDIPKERQNDSDVVEDR